MPIATSDALMGLGMPAQLSALMGGNPNALTTTGTAQGTAATIKSKNTELVTAGSQTGGILPSTAGVMEPYFINVQSATSGVVYVPSGHSLNGSANAGVTIAQGKAAIIWQYKKSNWCYLILA
jgi:hypothetical protein